MTGPASGAPDPAVSDSEKRSVFALISDLPRLIVANLRAEFDLLKAELTAKATKAITGAVLAITALVLLFFGIGVLLDAAVWALSLVWPHWLAALVVGGGIILIVVILALVALGQFRAIGATGRRQRGTTAEQNGTRDAAEKEARA